jgi:hypothetical protein
LELFNCPEDLSILSGAHQTPRLPGQALSAEALAQAIAVARDLDSDLARKLSNLCAEQPAQFEQMIRNSGQRLVAMGELKQRDPQLYGFVLFVFPSIFIVILGPASFRIADMFGAMGASP